MTSIYIAGHNQEEARKVALLCRAAGLQVTSTWLKEDFGRTSQYTDMQRREIACKDVEEVKASDGLVLLASLDRVPGGKFVEVGVALGLDKPVYVVGERENMLMWHPLVSQFTTVKEMIEATLKQEGR